MVGFPEGGRKSWTPKEKESCQVEEAGLGFVHISCSGRDGRWLWCLEKRWWRWPWRGRLGSHWQGCGCH